MEEIHLFQPGDATGRRTVSVGEVNPDTPLADINLNWDEEELPEKERTKHVHRLHPYFGKFIPQLAEVFLRKFFHKGQTVLDPFCGSGTTLVQANELGINAIGYDISAFNVLLARAKTDKYDIKKVSGEICDILIKTRRARRKMANQLSLWEISYPRCLHNQSGYLKEWFSEAALEELLAYRELIDNYEYQDILKVILSRSARSARLTTHFELDAPKKPQTTPYWCHKHGKTCFPADTAYPFLKRYSVDTIHRINAFARVRSDARVEVHHADSRFVAVPPIDGVITSPPYMGMIDYHEQHRYAYELLDIQDCSQFEIGSARKGSGKKARDEYQQSMVDVFKNICKSLSPDGCLVVIVADRQNMYPEIAKMCGLREEDVLHRPVTRRTSLRPDDFCESIFIWKKNRGKIYHCRRREAKR